MSCTYRDRNETILAYVRQELNSETQEAFEAHYFVCEECAAEVLFYEKTLLAMQGQGGIVFARPLAQRNELVASLRHLLNRWSEKFNLVWGEGGLVRALAGYALLIVFLGASSYWLLRATGLSSIGRMQEVDAQIVPSIISPSSHTAHETHMAWPAGLRFTADSILQSRLARIQPDYQIGKNYVKAGNELLEVINSTPQIDENVKVYFAVCLIKQQRNAEALDILQTISSNSSAHLHAQMLLQNLQTK